MYYLQAVEFKDHYIETFIDLGDLYLNDLN